MTTTNLNLLDIDATALFEQHSVPEIELIQKKLQHEVEVKKEELRTMVGARYRDLILAADTINEMKSSAGAAIVHFKQLSEGCRSLKDQQLIGFKTESSQIKPTNESKQHLYSVVIQISLLSQLPEIIWTHIDEEEYFLATQLFIFSRHISTGLQLEAKNAIVEKFPVAKKQWAVLNQFYFTIKQKCYSALERDNLTAETAAKCLASMQLLENCESEDLLKSFIQFRTKTFLKSVANEQLQFEKVRDKVLASLEILQNSYGILFELFIDSGDGQGLVFKKLETLSATNSKPSIDLISVDNKALLNILPSIILKFRPSVKVTDIAPGAWQNAVGNWLKSMSDIVNDQVTALVKLITSIKSIQNIKQEASQMRKNIKWDVICKRLHLPQSFDVYDYFYHAIFNAQVRNIMESSWQKLLVVFAQKVDDILSKQQRNDGKSSCSWLENIPDMPSAHQMLMKTKGFTPEIIEICEFLDADLKSLYEEVFYYLSTSTFTSHIEENKREHSEEQSLILSLRNISYDGILKLVENIKTANRRDEISPYGIALLARICQALVELCPHLKLCLSHSVVGGRSTSSSWTGSNQHSNNCEQWQKTKTLLKKESLECWSQWTNLFVKSLHQNLLTILATSNDVSQILINFSNWESIAVEEKDEQENSIKSTIRVPLQPSFPLQQYIRYVCNRLNEMPSHILPIEAATGLTDEIVIELYRIYEKISESKLVQTHQNVAVQYFFDVKFINFVFVARAEKPIGEKLQNLSNTLKSFVDPFDFELFYKYLRANIKRSVSNVQHELGCLIHNPEQYSNSFGKQQMSVIQEKDPNILPLSTDGALAMWFPLLPIVIPGNASNTIPTYYNKIGGKVGTATEQISNFKKDERSPQRNAAVATATATAASAATVPVMTPQNYANNVKSGAAAFFGAMSQDWFRSS